MQPQYFENSDSENSNDSFNQAQREKAEEENFDLQMKMSSFIGEQIENAPTHDHHETYIDP